MIFPPLDNAKLSPTKPTKGIPALLLGMVYARLLAMSNQKPVPPTGWLNTLEAAEVLGMHRRQFQEYTRLHPVAKTQIMERVGKPCYYDPQVIDQVRQNRAEAARSSAALAASLLPVDQPEETNEREAKAEAPAEKRVTAPETVKVEGTVKTERSAKTRPVRRPIEQKLSAMPSEKQELLHDLLQCAKANTAMLDRIAQNIGRIG